MEQHIPNPGAAGSNPAGDTNAFCPAKGGRSHALSLARQAFAQQTPRGRGVFYLCCKISGGSNAVTFGNSPSYRSISTMQVCAIGPWARLEVPLSGVSMFGLPCLQRLPGWPGASGSNQAPVGSCMTPGRMVSLMMAALRHAPRSLNRRTISPLLMLRAAASSGWSVTGSRPWILDFRL